ncbi:mitogen-activated protein kinase kinase kinase 12, partial [Biomphalaria glabrata]
REQQLTLYNKHRKSIVRPIIKAQEKLDRLGKKRTHRSGSEVTTPDSMKNTEGSMTTSSELVPAITGHPNIKLNPAGLHSTDHAPYTGTFKFLRPATAIREYRSEDEADGQETRTLHPIKNNINDVCFGCDGGCSDATCSSKRSSQVSADVESTCDLSPLPSPKQNLETMSEKSSLDIDL